MSKSYSQFHLTHLNPSYYYSNGKFMYARNHSSLYVTLKFPLSSFSHPLELYKAISLPVPVQHNSTSSLHATQLLTLPDYFAITPHHDLYVPLSSSDLINCQHDSIMLCDINLALRPITVPNCIMALFSNNRHQINNLCNFRFTQNLLKPNIIELTATSALVYNHKNLVLDCPEKKTIIPGCIFCIVNIPCRCSLSTAALYLSPRLVDCYNSSSSFTIVHPVNLALLQEFFDDSRLNSIFGDTKFPKPVNLSVPDFKFYNHSFSDIIANDHKMHLSLKKIAVAVKKDQKVFHNLAEPILDGLIGVPQTWPDFSAILGFSAIAISIFAIVLCIITFCKVKKLATSLLVLQQVQNAVSTTVPSFIFHIDTPTTSSYSNFFTTEFSWIHASVIIGTIVFVLILIVLFLLLKYKSRKCTILALELTSGGKCVIVPIMNLSLCPSYYQLSKPHIRDVSLGRLPSRSLIVTWSPFHIVDKRSKVSVPVPSTFGLNILNYLKCRQILLQPFSAYVVVIHNNYAFYLNNDFDLPETAIECQTSSS